MVSYMSKYFLFLTGVLLVATGCQSLKKYTPGSRETKRIVETLSKNEPNFAWLNGKAKIKYKEEKNNITVSASVRVRKDSLVWISVSPGLGIEVFRCVFTTDSVFALDKINKLFYALDYSSISKKFQIDFSYQTIQSVFLGRPPFGLNQADKARQAGNNFQVRRQLGAYQVNAFFNLKTALLEKIVIDQNAGNNKMLVDYRTYTQVGPNLLPMESTVRLTTKDNTKTEQANVNIRFRRLEQEDGPMQTPIYRPKSYPVINHP